MALRQIPDSDTLREAFDTTYNNDSSIEQQLGSKAAGDHTHEGYAPSVHTHDYAPTAHSHANYQALLETNLDLLMRGLLYTKASPFSQSFTFSGDGTRTAFKIPRASVNQQGWVRGGVTATVGGSSVSGTWNIHTQTYTLSAAPASGASVVVSSTDVVPYQGMAATTDTVRLLRPALAILATTSGTGASTSHTNYWLPASVKLPCRDDGTTDDLLLNDSLSAQGHRTFAPLMWLFASGFHSSGSHQIPPAGSEAQMGLAATSAQRTSVSLSTSWRWEATAITSSVPHISYMPALYKVVTPSAGSPFEVGELLLGMGGYYDSSPRILATSEAFDLFRLSGGPVVES